MAVFAPRLRSGLAGTDPTGVRFGRNRAQKAGGSSKSEMDLWRGRLGKRAGRRRPSGRSRTRGIRIKLSPLQSASKAVNLQIGHWLPQQDLELAGLIGNPAPNPLPRLNAGSKPKAEHTAKLSTRSFIIVGTFEVKNDSNVQLC